MRHLREEIQIGRLAPGTVIKDAELADRLDVSITPVREAIMLLSAEGLIDISPNRTRRVTDVSQKNALRTDRRHVRTGLRGRRVGRAQPDRSRRGPDAPAAG